MEFKERFVLARDYRMISNRTIADQLGISLSRIEKWENGIEIPLEKDYEPLGKILEVSVEYLKNDDASYICKRIAVSKLNVIKFFLILGAALTPFDFALSFLFLLGYKAWLFLFLFFITIPYYLITIHHIENAEDKENFPLYGIEALFCLSIIGGIAIFSVRKCDFIDCFDEVLAQSHYSEKKPMPGLVRTALYDISKEKNKLKKILLIKQATKNEISEALLAIEADALALESPTDYDRFRKKLKGITRISNVLKKLMDGIIGCIMLVVAGSVAFIVVKPIVKQMKEEKAEQQKIEMRYETLQNLLDEYYVKLENYSSLQYVFFDDFYIRYLIEELNDYYDMSEIKQKYELYQTYKWLIDYKHNLGEKNIEEYKQKLRNCPDDFLDTKEIKIEFEYIYSTIYYVKNTLSDYQNVSSTTALECRKSIRDLYSYCKSEYWVLNEMNFNSVVLIGAKLCFDTKDAYIVLEDADTRPYPMTVEMTNTDLRLSDEKVDYFYYHKYSEQIDILARCEEVTKCVGIIKSVKYSLDKNEFIAELQFEDSYKRTMMVYD